MDVLMPQLGETVAEGKITKWFKAAGDAVKPGDNLFEIETDKVSMEVPSTTTGVLSEIRVAVGEVAPVGAVVGVIADGSGAAANPAVAVAPAANRWHCSTGRRGETPGIASAKSAAAARCAAERTARSVLRGAHAGAQLRPGAACRAGVAVTPLARRLAGEAGIDLAANRAAPVRTAASSRATSQRRRRRRLPSLRDRAPAEIKALFAPGSYEEVPLDGMRRTIAARLTQAARPFRISI